MLQEGQLDSKKPFAPQSELERLKLGKNWMLQSNKTSENDYRAKDHCSAGRMFGDSRLVPLRQITACYSATDRRIPTTDSCSIILANNVSDSFEAIVQVLVRL